MATRTTKKAEPKTTTAKTAIEKEAPAKTAAEPAKADAATAKKNTEKTTARKTAAKKTAEKSASAKKPAVKRTAAKKTASVNAEVYVQFWGKEVYAKDIVESVKKIWTDEMGKKESELKDLKVYIKPEDTGALYVINLLGDITRSPALSDSEKSSGDSCHLSFSSDRILRTGCSEHRRTSDVPVQQSFYGPFHRLQIRSV